MMAIKLHHLLKKKTSLCMEDLYQTEIVLFQFYFLYVSTMYHINMYKNVGSGCLISLISLQVSYDRLQGIDAEGSIATNVHGGLFYDPLTGDMVSTVHSSPQVRLYINDVPTACTGDCSFNWETSSTPTISNINPLSGEYFHVFPLYF